MCKVTCFQHVFTFRMSRVPFIHLAQKRINISSHIHFWVIISMIQFHLGLKNSTPQSLPAGRHPAGHEAIFLAAWSAPSAAFKPFFLRRRPGWEVFPGWDPPGNFWFGCFPQWKNMGCFKAFFVGVTFWGNGWPRLSGSRTLTRIY